VCENSDRLLVYDSLHSDKKKFTDISLGYLNRMLDYLLDDRDLFFFAISSKGKRILPCPVLSSPIGSNQSLMQWTLGHFSPGVKGSGF